MHDTDRLAAIEAKLAEWRAENYMPKRWMLILDMAEELPWLCAELRSAWQRTSALQHDNDMLGLLTAQHAARIEALEAQVAQLTRQMMEFEGEL